jgi:hypothetical protein
MTLSALWTQKLRPNLHCPANWTCNENVKLVYVPSSAGFCGPSQKDQFLSNNSAEQHIFNEPVALESINCSFNESSRQICDEFVLTWTQKSSRMDWLLPGNDFPLQSYRCSFVVSAQISESMLLQSVRVYWDQGSLLLQTGILSKSLKSLVKPGNIDALENTLCSLPLYNDYAALLTSDPSLLNCLRRSAKPVIGALNNITSILNDLPHSSSGLAVSTPKMPARSRSINPALMGTLNFDKDLPFDSPLPPNTRSVKSRNIFSDEPEKTAATNASNYHPGLASNERFLQNAKSHIFDEDSVYKPTLNLNETYSHQYESSIFNPNRSPSKKLSHNLPQTDKILFESHVFDSMNSDHKISDAATIKHVATAPPQCPSHIISPEEDLKVQSKAPSASLSRPSMLGHFHGSSIGETCNDKNSDKNEPIKFVPSTAIRFDPNQSQIRLGGDEENDSNRSNRQPSTRKSTYDPNRSQIFLGDYSSSG